MEFRKADWPEFKINCSDELTPDLTKNIRENKVEIVTSSLHFIAEVSIPKTSAVPKKLNKPWWNKECEEAVKERRRTLRVFKKIILN